MKRFHGHVAVADLDQSIRFYSKFFDVPPTVQKDDYAKWMLDDPRINFAISARGKAPGLDHLGIQVEDSESLKEISMRLKQAQQPVLDQEQTTCCYAKADKAWVHDPQGIAWESFYTTGSATTYGEDTDFTNEPGISDETNSQLAATPQKTVNIAGPPLTNSACCTPSEEQN